MERLTNKSIRKSYAIPEDLIEYFEKESRTRDSSSSTLVSQAMRKAATFYIPLSKIGTVTVSVPCFQAIIERMKPEDLEDMAREQSTRNFGVLLSLLGGKPDFFSILEKYYEIFGKYSGWYTFKHETSSQGYRLVFQHTKGIKWSRYLSEYNHVILDKLCDKVDCHIDNNVVNFDVVLKKPSIAYNEF